MERGKRRVEWTVRRHCHSVGFSNQQNDLDIIFNRKMEFCPKKEKKKNEMCGNKAIHLSTGGGNNCGHRNLIVIRAFSRLARGGNATSWCKRNLTFEKYKKLSHYSVPLIVYEMNRSLSRTESPWRGALVGLHFCYSFFLKNLT